MDPLRCLRDFYASKRAQEVSFADSYAKVNFGDEYEFSSTTATRFQNQKGEAYQLGALVFFMQHRTVSAADYMQRVKAADVSRVARADQQVRAHPFSAQALRQSRVCECRPGKYDSSGICRHASCIAQLAFLLGWGAVLPSQLRPHSELCIFSEA